MSNDSFRRAPCKGGAFQWVQGPPGDSLQPEAIGAVMEVIKAASDHSPRRQLPRFAADSPLEEGGFELVWGFSCQVVVLVLLPVLCSERESRSSSRRLRSGSRSARKGSRDRNASTAWRLAA